MKFIKSALPLLILLIPYYLTAQIYDIIPRIKLIQNERKEIVVSDLFYLQKYNLEFEQNKYIDVEYDQNNNILRLDPGSFNGATLIHFRYAGEEYSIPVFVTSMNKIRFAYKADKNSKIFLFGNFNNWNRIRYPLTYNQQKQIFEITVPLDFGRYEYKFVVNGNEVIDPENPNKIPNGLGGENSVINIPKPEGELYLHLKDFMDSSEFLAIKFIVESRNTVINKGDNTVIALLNNRELKSSNIVIDGNNISVDIPVHSIKRNDLLRVTVSNSDMVSNTQTIPLWSLPGNQTEFNWYDGTIYSIMIDRFMDGDKSNDDPVIHDSLLAKANYMGGDLEGIIDKLEEGYFDSLGVNVLWISPVYDNPDEAFREYPAPHRWYSGYHGYWPISATKVESRFGNMETLKQLVSSAHRHNIKVLLDFVSNHIHREHPYYRNHRNWFGKLKLPDGRFNLRFWDEFRLTTWFEPYLPSFDYINSREALDTMTNNAVWWLNETGADGFRHDAVKHVPNIFWRTLTRKIDGSLNQERRLKVYQIGETFGGYDLVSSYVNNGQLDAQFNFNLYNTAINVFTDSTSSFTALDEELKKTFSIYGIMHEMGNIMDSHDKDRFTAIADGDIPPGSNSVEIGWQNPPVVDNPNTYKKAELYYAYMFSIPGLPVIYYGSEFGMTGAADPDNRRMMRFGSELTENERSMLDDVRKISNIREEHSALRYGDFYTLKVNKDLYAYIRSDLNERVLVILNKSNKIRNVKLDLPNVYHVRSAADLLENSNYQVNYNSIELSIAQYEYKFVLLKASN